MSGNVLIPSSPLCALLCYRGNLLMNAPERAVRRIHRDQALAKLKTTPVQGRQALLSHNLHLHSLEPILLSSVKIPGEWRYLCVQGDLAGALDLFPPAYRITRSIGGSWTELLH